MTDIKTLLGNALDDEPPLRIHRDDITQQGKKKLTQRAWTGAAAAMVTLIAITVPITMTSTGNSQIPGNTPTSLTLPQVLPGFAIPATDTRATELTEVLRKADLDNNGLFVFTPKGDYYLATHEVTMERNPPVTIRLEIEVRRGVWTACDRCETHDLADRRVVVHPTSIDGNGSKREVSAYLVDGTHIRVTSTSSDREFEPVAFEELGKYASLQGLRF